MEQAEVIVVGLGSMGSAAAYQLARHGVSVIGIDRFSPPHVFGSTHGDTRITRQAIGEGKSYVPFVLRSHQIWREIEQESGVDLLTQCGGLILSATSSRDPSNEIDDFFASTVSTAEEFKIEHTLLSVDELVERFPQFQLDEDHHCYYEPGAGFVRPEAAVRTQLDLASQHGASLHRDERVTGIEATSSGVIVDTDKGRYGAHQAIVTVGPWITHLVDDPTIVRSCKVHRQTLHWFETSGRFDIFEPERMPIFIWKFGQGVDDGFYGFPAIDGPQGGVKVARSQYVSTTDPDDLRREVSEEESQAMFNRYVNGRLPGLRRSTVKATTCLYTATPDHRFIIDRHPEHANVLVASPCSGHGFKHSAAIGESLAQLARDGSSSIDLSSFTLDRFANATNG